VISHPRGLTSAIDVRQRSRASEQAMKLESSLMLPSTLAGICVKDLLKKESATTVDQQKLGFTHQYDCCNMFQQSKMLHFPCKTISFLEQKQWLARKAAFFTACVSANFMGESCNVLCTSFLNFCGRQKKVPTKKKVDQLIQHVKQSAGHI
jgi:hypothetical protein